ncbi:hypothetical protein [Nannocystis pusilla]|uniref:hypothetical protein n=1 Tax=Nannocystis pusilla TaxID=889268 RepID=UPI003DA5FCAC
MTERGDTAAAEELATGLSGPTRPRWVVIHWTPEALGLVRAIAAAEPAPELTLIGPAPADEVAAALAELPAGHVQKYWQGSASGGVEALARFFADTAGLPAADAIIVLPLRGHGETDAFSRLVCTAILRACKGKPPHVVVAVEDPEATHEFEGLGVATIFYPGFLRAALLAHACIDLGAFRFMLALLGGRLRVETWPVPPELRAGTFREACLNVEVDRRGRPVTLIGLFAPGEGGPDAMLLSPSPARPLRDASALLVLTGEAE